MKPFTIYRDIPVKIRHKCSHVRKVGGKSYYSFINDYGDVPVSSINDITGKMEWCQNNRGSAYAARKRLQYRKRKPLILKERII